MIRHKRLENTEPVISQRLLASVRQLSQRLESPADLDRLIERIGDARFVLLGEASHGTHEFYTWRTELSQRLIAEKGFSFIAVEGDLPDCYLVNRYVKGHADAGDSAQAALQLFARWPTWMWANEEVADLAEWMREHNRKKPMEKRAGFFGLDDYSLWESLYQVMSYLRKTDSAAMLAAQRAFNCFEPHGEDAQAYARAARFVPASCETEVIDLLKAVRAQAPRFPHDDNESQFVAEQNALVLKNAETYYRTMVGGQAASWNVRDRHMTETLDRLIRHHGPHAKAIVWEHNTHIGDARCTNMADEGMINVGQLVREAHADDGVVLVGFGSHHGTVIAGDAWEAPMERKRVPAARAGSWEDVLHRAGEADKLLLFDGGQRDDEWLCQRGHRAIGVVYHPEYEHRGNYVPTILPRRYDALIYLDATRALHPLHMMVEDREELPETYPTGM
jgi:erythromycin esterase-like protein